MSDVYKKNVPLIPQKSHFHGNMCTGNHSRQQQPVQMTTTLPVLTMFTSTFLFHIYLFLVKLEATSIYAAGAASQTLFHNDRRPPLRRTHMDPASVPESWPWVLVLQRRLQEIIHKHTLCSERSGSSSPAIYFKNAKQGYVCNLCLLTPKRRHFPPFLSLFLHSFGAKSRLSCKANEAKILTFLWNFPEVKLNCWAPWCNLLCLLFSRYQIPDIPSNTCCQATFSLKVKSPQKDFESKVLIVLASFPAIPGYCPDYKIHLYWRKSVFRVTFQADAHADPVSPQRWWALRGRMSNLYSEHVQQLEWPGPGEGLLSLPSTTWQAAEHLVRMLFYYITLESQWLLAGLLLKITRTRPEMGPQQKSWRNLKKSPPHTSSATHDGTASEDPHALHAFSSIHEWHIHSSLSSRY